MGSVHAWNTTSFTALRQVNNRVISTRHRWRLDFRETEKPEMQECKEAGRESFFQAFQPIQFSKSVAPSSRGPRSRLEVDREQSSRFCKLQTTRSRWHIVERTSNGCWCGLRGQFQIHVSWTRIFLGRDNGNPIRGERSFGSLRGTSGGGRGRVAGRSPLRFWRCWRKTSQRRKS